MRKSRRRRKRPQQKKGIQYRTNEQIRVPEVQLIDEDGPVGVIPTSQALRRAQESGLDLVEVSPKQQPPVAKIMDYGQFQYQQEKQRSKQAAKTKKVGTKGIRLTFRISSSDLEMRRRQASAFLDKGHKVKIEMILRGRERQHKRLAMDKVAAFVDRLREDFEIAEDQAMSAKGNRLIMVIGSRGRKQDEEDTEE